MYYYFRKIETLLLFYGICFSKIRNILFKGLQKPIKYIIILPPYPYFTTISLNNWIKQNYN